MFSSALHQQQQPCILPPPPLLCLLLLVALCCSALSLLLYGLCLAWAFCFCIFASVPPFRRWTGQFGWLSDFVRCIICYLTLFVYLIPPCLFVFYLGRPSCVLFGCCCCFPFDLYLFLWPPYPVIVVVLVGLPRKALVGPLYVTFPFGCPLVEFSQPATPTTPTMPECFLVLRPVVMSSLFWRR